MVKNLPANTGHIRDAGSFSWSGRSPGRGHGNPLQYSCLKNPHGQRNLVGYSPWGPKESDTTERLYIYIYMCACTTEQTAYVHMHVCMLSCVCVYICNGSYKKNEIMPFTATWIQLEIIILSEVSQKEKDKYHTNHLYVESKI